MRKIFFVVAFFASQFLNAQNDKRAATILDGMGTKYKSMTSFRVAFTYTNEGASTKDSYRGEATVQGTKFRLKMAGQEIFNDGKVMTTYVKETNEATVNNYDPKDVGDVDPTRIYTAYKKRL
jgi:outer membrane lipoprotein-sorting protein